MTTYDRIATRVEAELRAQGLSAAIDDHVAQQVVAILGAGDDHRRARRLDRLRQELAQLEVRWTPGADDGTES
jgi:hypothetical protein